LSIYSSKAPVELVRSWGWLRLWGAACEAGLGANKAGSWAHHGHARSSGRSCLLLICVETIDAATFMFRALQGKLKSSKPVFLRELKKKKKKKNREKS